MAAGARQRARRSRRSCPRRRTRRLLRRPGRRRAGRAAKRRGKLSSKTGTIRISSSVTTRARRGTTRHFPCACNYLEKKPNSFHYLKTMKNKTLRLFSFPPLFSLLFAFSFSSLFLSCSHIKRDKKKWGKQNEKKVARRQKKGRGGGGGDKEKRFPLSRPLSPPRHFFHPVLFSFFPNGSSL